MSVIVLGSLNMDLVVTTPKLPMPGETLTGSAFFTVSGGKGANQAVACARLGVLTRLIGQVGGDGFGATLRERLIDYGVDVENVRIESAQASGVALIQVDATAQNTIIVVPGANGTVGTANLEALKGVLHGASALLLQLEIPIATVIEAARLAHQQGVTVILDPAPAQPLPPELYHALDILTPNQSEAQALSGIAVHTPADAQKAAEVLIERGVPTVIIKMGAQGVFWMNQHEAHHVATFPVTAIDTVAAGDAFNGGLAAALDARLPFAESIRWALATSAIAVTRQGAQPSMPSRAEVLALLAQHPA